MKPVLSSTATRLRWNTILPYINGSVLDIGCGWTSLPDLLRPEQIYTGIDSNPEALAYDTQKYPHHRFMECDLDTGMIDLGTERFDTVVMTAVVEHLKSPQVPIAAARGLIEPGGLFVVTTPSPWGDLLHKVGGRLGLFYSESFVGHEKIFKKHELIDLLQAGGFEVLEYRLFAGGANQLAVCKRRFDPR